MAEPNAEPDTGDWVGPVLQPGPWTGAVVESLIEANRGAKVIDRGAYLRVLARSPCRLERAAVERRTGQPFRLPSDLEAIMPAFKGRLSLSEEGARWD